MDDFDYRLALFYETVRQEEIRCLCIAVCVALMVAAVLGAVVITTLSGSDTESVCTVTDAGGTTTTTIRDGWKSITTVTDAQGRVVSTIITGTRRK